MRAVLKFGLKKLPDRGSFSKGLKSRFSLKPKAIEIYDILLSWQDNSEDETSFVIEHSLDSIEWTVLVTLPADTTSYLVTIETDGVESDIKNCFRIKAVNGTGESPYSEIVEV